jgi:hypothetical protein
MHAPDKASTAAGSVCVPLEWKQEESVEESVEERASKSESESASKGLTILVPSHLASDECTEASLQWLVGVFKANVMHIYAAILCGKRVLFIGESAWEACCAVTSACQLVGSRGVHGGIVGSLARCFPYVNLTDLSFMQMPGFIAGGVNPLFQRKQEWYDVCATITDGRVLLSAGYREQLELTDFRAQEELDRRFVKDALVQDVGEYWLRELFASYTTQMLNVVFGREVFVDEHAQQAFLRANQFRMNNFCRSFQMQAHAAHEHTLLASSPLGGDEAHWATYEAVLTLQRKPVLPVAGVCALLERLLAVVGGPAVDASPPADAKESGVNQARVRALLMWLLPVDGGLFCIASLLLHRKQAVRARATRLMQCIEQCGVGKQMLSQLNPFLLSTFRRIKSKTAV